MSRPIGLPLVRQNKTEDQAIGVSRGGCRTKIHATSDVLDRPIDCIWTGGQHCDIKFLDELLPLIGPCKRFIADRAYDANALRTKLGDNHTKPTIPLKKNRKDKIPLNHKVYKQRWRVENVFCQIKDFRRVATRDDKLAQTFRNAVTLAILYKFWL